MVAITIESEEQWHALRRQTVGASEVASLFDLSPYLTRLELWLTKSGRIEGTFVETERMRLGRLLESGIIQAAMYKEQWFALNASKKYYVHPSAKGMGATPDALIQDVRYEGPGCLEVKNIDFIHFRDTWTDGEPPYVYLLQLQHQLACTGLKWGAIAALVGGNDLKVWYYDRHEPTIAKLEAAVTAFWRSVEAGEEPKAVADDYESVFAALRHDNGLTVDLRNDNELPSLCSDVIHWGALRRDAEKREKEAKARILQKIGEAAHAMVNGYAVKATTVRKVIPPKPEPSTQEYRLLTIKEFGE